MPLRKHRKTLTIELLRARLIYDPKTGMFTRRTTVCGHLAGSKVGHVSENKWGYLYIGLCGRDYSAGRLAWFYVHGVWPKKEIDHINLDKLDNRLSNLREASNAENARNKPTYKNNKSGFPGVYWHKTKRKWVSCLGHAGRLIEIGLFNEPLAAYKARCELAKKLHGEFVRI